MRGITLGLIVLGMLGLAGASQAAKISPEPAATLLLPYFEVDIANPSGVNTTFSVNNAFSSAVLAHVTFWSDLSVPFFAFDLSLTGYDQETVDLRDILVNGILPPQAVFPVSGCTGPPPRLPSLFLASLQDAATGQFSPLTGHCAGLNLGDNIARGYITVDTVNNCTQLFPSDPDYFRLYATDDNVLWGDYFYLDPSRGTSAGNTLVHIPAESSTPSSGSYTFYGRYVGWTGIDKRRPLATSFAARFLGGGSAPVTDLIVWRDPKVTQTFFTCATLPSWFPLGQEGLAVFDDQENLSLLSGATPFAAATQRVEVGGPAFPVPYSFGWINLNLNTVSTVPPSDPTAAQGWVSISLDSGGSLNMGYDAIQIDNATNALHSVPP